MSMIKRQAGFTLIEIVLVLAIAGSLLVIVFLAVGGAQRARQDSQRRTDLSRVAALVEEYASNNAGRYPTTLEVDTPTSQFRVNYGMTQMKDPVSGQFYVVRPTFDNCDPSASWGNFGPGTISYTNPGLANPAGGNYPYTVRICLSKGEFYVNK